MKDYLGSGKLKNTPEGFSPLRKKINRILYAADTKSGRFAEIILLFFITMSIVIMMLETVPGLSDQHGKLFSVLEIVFTVFFTVEFILRLYGAYKAKYYLLSFFGFIDIISILPFYLLYFSPALKPLLVIRAMRLVRIFRVFKLQGFIEQANVIINALVYSAKKIIVFTFSIIILVCIFGSVMYLVENGVNSNFDSVPRSIYWTIVTITTVGYGDISPVTAFGQFMASIIMISGYVIIAVPTGIVTYSVVQANRDRIKDSRFCSLCGKELK